MSGNPLFSYFLSNPICPVNPDQRIWNSPLPLSKNDVHRYLEEENHLSISHGDYFSAVRSYLMQNRFEVLTSTLTQHFNRDIRADEIKEIRIVLEKHGEFYHPARIEVVIYEMVVSFVVNVAVSDVGNEYILKDFSLMQRLNTDFPQSFIPKVYGNGEVPVIDGDIVLRMFLGAWFEGFNEFHLIRDNDDKKLKLVVWDPDDGNVLLSKNQAKELYSQVAMILTYYYNIETSEQISLWHHAAGDFVVKLGDEKMETRLVTIRKYASMFDGNNAEEQAPEVSVVLNALLVFFLNLSIRIRLDRLGGIGDMAWSDNMAIEGTLSGFFRGLAKKSKDGLIPKQLADVFKNYLLKCTEADLFDLAQAIVGRYNPRAPEIPVIKENFKEHISVLYREIHHI
jgi:hypothetical protein